jgi:hypothetical protein
MCPPLQASGKSQCRHLREPEDEKLVRMWPMVQDRSTTDPPGET